jgi:hypothetical protein
MRAALVLDDKLVEDAREARARLAAMGGCDPQALVAPRRRSQPGIFFALSGNRARQEAGMGKVIVFNLVSLDGCFVDPRGDMSWAQIGRAHV